MVLGSSHTEQSEKYLWICSNSQRLTKGALPCSFPDAWRGVDGRSLSYDDKETKRTMGKAKKKLEKLYITGIALQNMNWQLLTSIVIGVSIITLTAWNAFFTMPSIQSLQNESSSTLDKIKKINERIESLQQESSRTLDEIKKINEREFEIENFPLEISAIASDIILDDRIYQEEPITGKISLSVLSPHDLKVVVNNVTLHLIDPASWPRESLPTVRFEKPVTKFLPRESGNLDFEVPMKFSIKPLGDGWYITGLGPNVGVLDFEIEIIDIQSDETYVRTFQSELLMIRIIGIEQIEILK